DSRLGVVPFNVVGVPHALTAAILSAEWGIGVRSGCFCAHPYITTILGVSESEAKALEKSVLARDRSAVPGAVRASFGISSTAEDVERLREAVEAVARGKFSSGYVLDTERGEYTHPELPADFARRVAF